MPESMKFGFLKSVAYLLTMLVSISAKRDPRFPNVAGYKVIRVTANNASEKAFLVDALGIHSSLEDIGEKSEIEDIHFWTKPNLGTFGRNLLNLDILVSPRKYQELSEKLQNLEKEIAIVHDDAYKLFENSASGMTRSAAATEMHWRDYQSYGTIKAFLEKLAEEYNFVKLHKIGETFEGRDLVVLEINTANAGRGFWMDGGIHAREWISPAVVTYLLNEFTNNYSDHKEIVDSFRWYFMPVVNPDGYEYSRLKNRMWRKTRSVPPKNKCKGVDGNRNYNVHWMEGVSSSENCDQNYAGPEPESENCIKALTSFVLNHLQSNTSNAKLAAYYAFHSYGQVWLSPHGWTHKLPPTYDQLMRVAGAGVDAIAKVHGTIFERGSAANILPPATGGGADDWAYEVAKVPFAYTVELRDTGSMSFLLPPQQIIPSGEEMLAGVKASALEILKILK